MRLARSLRRRSVPFRNAGAATAMTIGKEKVRCACIRFRLIAIRLCMPGRADVHCDRPATCLLRHFGYNGRQSRDGRRLPAKVLTRH